MGLQSMLVFACTISITIREYFKDMLLLGPSYPLEVGNITKVRAKEYSTVRELLGVADHPLLACLYSLSDELHNLQVRLLQEDLNYEELPLKSMGL